MFFLAGSALMAGSVSPSVGFLEHRALSVSFFVFFFLWKVGEGPLVGLWFGCFLGPQFKEDSGGTVHTSTWLFPVGLKAQDSGFLALPCALTPVPRSYVWASDLGLRMASGT